MIDAIASLASSIVPTLAVAPLNNFASGPAATTAAAATDGGFSQMLSQVATDAVQTLKTAEASSMGGIQGKVSTQKVVESVMQAQETLQTTLAIRDKVVSAYQEISRMAI